MVGACVGALVPIIEGSEAPRQMSNLGSEKRARSQRRDGEPS